MRSQIYKMTVDLNVIDHLGLNLYSNISAVLTEAVANAGNAVIDGLREAVWASDYEHQTLG